MRITAGDPDESFFSNPWSPVAVACVKIRRRLHLLGFGCPTDASTATLQHGLASLIGQTHGLAGDRLAIHAITDGPHLARAPRIVRTVEKKLRSKLVSALIASVIDLLCGWTADLRWELCSIGPMHDDQRNGKKRRPRRHNEFKSLTTTIRPFQPAPVT